jgi:hypothetical protein
MHAAPNISTAGMVVYLNTFDINNEVARALHQSMVG